MASLDEICPIALPAGLDLTREVLIGDRTVEALPGLIDRWLGALPLALADPDTAQAAPEALALGRTRLTLERRPHTDDETIDRVARRASAARASGILAVGSGTINDLAKAAAERLGLPYVVFGTAASMNGYGSGVAAILSEGLKITRPARPPRGICLDTRILREAPAALTGAGLGDLLSKPLSDTDWWLAHQLDGSGYDPLPGRLVERAVAEATRLAGGLVVDQAAAFEALGRALILSGVAMAAAGSSAPASGGEHLISHLWDMEATAAGRPLRLHGAQVGVASCVSAALYQRLLGCREAPLEAAPGEEAAAFGPLALAVEGALRCKRAQGARRLGVLRTRWPAIRASLAKRELPTPAAVRAPLEAAGAPSTLAALGVERASAARVLRLARHIRDRVTVLDVGALMGLLPDQAPALLDQAGV